MKEFMMIFRHTPNPQMQLTPEQMQESIKKWQDWMGGIAAQGKFVSTGRLNSNGKTLKQNNVISDGPYTELKEIVGGYVICKADDIDEGLKLAEGCPIFGMGGHVEVREMIKM